MYKSGNGIPLYVDIKIILDIFTCCPENKKLINEFLSKILLNRIEESTYKTILMILSLYSSAFENPSGLYLGAEICRSF